MGVKTLRVAILAAGVAGWLSISAGRAHGPFAAVMLLLVVLSALAPGGAVPTAFLLAIVVLQLAQGRLDLRLPLTVAAVGAHHALCTVAAALPPDARIRPDALRRPLRQFLLAQAGALLLLGCAVMARRLDRSLPEPVLLSATGVVLVAIAGVAGVAAARHVAPGRRPHR